MSYPVAAVRGRGSAAAAAAGWWALGAGAYGIYQAAAAASLAASYVELSGGGAANLSGATPTWNATDGWTSAVTFAAQSYLDGGDFTFYWAGSIEKYGAAALAVSADWDGKFILQPHATGLYGGANASVDDRRRIVLDDGTFAAVIYYVKRNDNSQSLYINGVEDSGAGSAYSVNSFAFSTIGGVGKCKAFGVFRAAHSAGELADIVAALAAL